MRKQSNSPAGTALTIAGLDPTGGAGLVADLMTFAAYGIWGTSVATAITVQTTEGVKRVAPVDPGLVGEQIEAITADIRPDAVKLGMLGSADTAHAVAQALDRLEGIPLVLDPVLSSWDGSDLSGPGTLDAICEHLIPKAACITPNSEEAGELSGIEVTDEKSARLAARRILDMGAAAVLIKGGHLSSEAGTVRDVLFLPDGELAFSHERIAGRDPHGTGCILSSAIAAGLALGLDLRDAAGDAISRLQSAMRNALNLGSGKKLLLIPLSPDRDQDRR